MFVCGFTIIRNGVEFSYPFIESIKSLLPLVDKLIINLGISTDGTGDKIRSLRDPRIEILEREWDLSMREGGKLLSYETNKALEKCEGDWGFYLQADEVIHENDYDRIYDAMKKYLQVRKIKGLTFRYYHFEGTYDFYNPLRYRKEIRIIRPEKGIVSWGDAATFRYSDGRRLKTKPTGAFIYHYGWVRSPEEMLRRKREFEKLYHDDRYIEEKYGNLQEFPYFELDLVKRFRGTHPAVMRERIASMSWDIEIPPHKPLLLNPKFYRIILRKWGIIRKR